MRSPIPSILLVLGLVPALAVDAHARGGRFSGPSSAAPPSVRAPESAEAPEARSPDCPMPPEGNPAEPPTVTPGVPTPTLGTGRRANSVRAPGLGDWMYWYEANREQFEDLRSTLFVTRDNPLFAVGSAAGDRVGAPERRLDAATAGALRDALLAVLADPAREHGLLALGAAYVALGKIAVDDRDVERLTRPLAPGSDATTFERESALLALGQLRRSDSRRQLPGTTLDGVRAVLLRALEGEGESPRARGLAAVSLGLLADQPGTKAGVATAQRLFAAMWRGGMGDEAEVGACVGLGLVHPADVPATLRAGLQKIARDGRVGARTWTAPVRAQALLALGRVGVASDARVVTDLLERRTETAPVLTQGAVLAAGCLAVRHPAARLPLASALLSARDGWKDPATRGSAWIAFGRILAADAMGGRGETLRATRAGSALREALRDGSQEERGYAALGLALAARAVPADLVDADWQAFRAQGLDALRDALGSRANAPHTRAAFALGLGLARAEHAVTPLLDVARATDADPELRAYAVLGLGLLGKARKDVVAVATAALRDGRSDRLRMNAATALGLLGGGSAKDRDRSLRVLVDALVLARNKHVKGRLAITLARIGDERAVEPIRDVLATPEEQPLSRAIACAALGLLGDEERTPVLAEARRDCLYLGGSSVVLEVLDVL